MLLYVKHTFNLKLEEHFFLLQGAYYTIFTEF